jgi:hypothetical protein
MVRRDHQSIFGDLIEEYREVVLPTRGRLHAALWFVRQMLSLVQPWMWGLLLGITLGSLNLVSAAVAPLAEDTPPQMMAIAVSVLSAWTLIGFAAERRRFRLGDSVSAGISAAVLSTGITSAANLTRKVLFLDVIQHRSDWQGLLLRFEASGSADLKSFVVAEHLHGLIGGLIFSAAVGAICGAIGGAISCARRERPSPAPR